MKHFGLRNSNGSCWINAALQAVFRIPDFQTFLEDDDVQKNDVEDALTEIWASSGDEGLRALYESARVLSNMPAGDDIGDSHEFIQFLCDKVPVLDKLMRFKVANVIRCQHCDYKDTHVDSMNEFSITPVTPKQSLSSAIVDTFKVHTIDDWTCEKCQNKGCGTQLVVAELPQVMAIHQVSHQHSVAYTPILIINKNTYHLSSIVCFTGGHWLTWGRNLGTEKEWRRFDDKNVQSSELFPQDPRMRLLVYYRINE